MELTRFETEVLANLLQDRFTRAEWQALLSSYEVISYKFTAAGYFLSITSDKIRLEKETIYQPLIIGKVNKLEVGFLLFAEGSNLTIECHSWGDSNLPDDIRELDINITVEK
jgi:hypothetical protein